MMLDMPTFHHPVFVYLFHNTNYAFAIEETVSASFRRRILVIADYFVQIILSA